MSDRCTIDTPGRLCSSSIEEDTHSRCDCGAEGRPVERRTVLHHLKHDQLERANGDGYRFCPNPNCEVAYFDPRGAHFTLDDLRELVTVKTQADARPICYCFGFTEGCARKEIEKNGSTTIPAEISSLIKAGMCACEIRNPAGVCCLGEVNRTVTRLAAELASHVD